MDLLIQLIRNLQDRVEKLEKGMFIKKITIPSDGYFVIQKLSSDPASPTEGQIWENTTTHTLKTYLNGAVKTISAS